MGNKICLVVACYDGPREDRLKQAPRYIEAQLHNLNKYKHQSDIVFVMTNSNPELSSARDIHTGWKKDSITYLYRSNIGLSFGSWVAAVQFFRDKYDYYIFLEDDYCFIKDGFDEMLVDEFNRNSVNYVSTWAGMVGSIPLLSTVGVTSSRALSQLNYFEDMQPRQLVPKYWQSRGHNMIWFFHYLGVIFGPLDLDDAPPFRKLADMTGKYGVFLYWAAGYHHESLAQIEIGGFKRNPRRTVSGPPPQVTWPAACLHIYGAREGESMEDIVDRSLMCPYQMLDNNFDVRTDLVKEDSFKWVFPEDVVTA